MSNEFNKFIILSNGVFTTDTAKLIELIVDLRFIIFGVVFDNVFSKIDLVFKAILEGDGEPGYDVGNIGIDNSRADIELFNNLVEVFNGVTKFCKLSVIFANESIVLDILFNLPTI